MKTKEQGFKIKTNMNNQVSGYYKKWTGDAEYETQELKQCPVTDPIPFPDKQIDISITHPNNIGLSFKISFNFEGRGSVSARMHGRMFLSETFECGVLDDVRQYLVDNGFLSKVHWEREEYTIQTDFNHKAIVDFEYKNGGSFSRTVNEAGENAYRLLYDSILEIMHLPSMARLSALMGLSTDWQETIKFPYDTAQIKIEYSPQGPFFGGCYSLEITPQEIYMSTFPNREKRLKCNSSRFGEIISQLQKIKIRPDGVPIPFSPSGHSESPDSWKLVIKKTNGESHRYWVKAIAGYVYGNILFDSNVLNGIAGNAIPELEKFLGYRDNYDEMQACVYGPPPVRHDEQKRITDEPGPEPTVYGPPIKPEKQMSNRNSFFTLLAIVFAICSVLFAVGYGIYWLIWG